MLLIAAGEQGIRPGVDLRSGHPWGIIGEILGEQGTAQQWHLGRGQFGLAFGADRTIYVADNFRGESGVCPSGTLYAATPSGHRKWRLDGLGVSNLDGCPPDK